MGIKVNEYRQLWVSIITLAPDEILSGYSDGNGLGGFLVYGSAAAIVDGVRGEFSSRLGWTSVSMDGPWLDAWQDRAAVKGKGYLQGGPDGCQWLCLTGVGDYRPLVTPQVLEGRLTISAGQRFVVARGIVEFDSQQGEQGNCFAPRDVDMDVTGSADILVLT